MNGGIGMFGHCLAVNAAGNLTIGGLDTVELAQTYGTPLLVMDEAEIRRACRGYQRAMQSAFDGGGQVLYASKAFCCKAMCRIAADEGLGLDVVSGGELYTALAAGFPPERMYMHGNSKTVEELAYAVQAGVGHIVVDNLTELEQLQEIAFAAKQRVNVLFRVKPGIDAHTHDYIKTGHVDSKFGFALQTGEAFAAIRAAMRMDSLRIAGVHCHIGSQIVDLKPFQLAAEVMLEFMAQVRSGLGVTLGQLNLGGGFGIRELPSHDAAAYGQYLHGIARAVKSVCAEQDFPCPKVIIEPGRSIVAPAGITLYRAGAVKPIPEVRTYVAVDGGMTDNPRYALYHAQYDMVVANRAAQPKQQLYTIAGRCCESGDLLGENIPLQEVQPGDILAVLGTGAYNYSMASNYNRVPRPAVVMVRKGQAQVAIRRETYADLLRCDQ